MLVVTRTDSFVRYSTFCDGRATLVMIKEEKDVFDYDSELEWIRIRLGAEGRERIWGLRGRIQ